MSSFGTQNAAPHGNGSGSGGNSDNPRSINNIPNIDDDPRPMIMRVVFQCTTAAERDLYAAMLRATGSGDLLRVPFPGEACVQFGYRIRREGVNPVPLVVYFRLDDNEESRIRWILFDSEMTRTGLIEPLGQEV